MTYRIVRQVEVENREGSPNKQTNPTGRRQKIKSPNGSQGSRKHGKNPKTPG